MIDEEIKELREEGCSCLEQFLVGFGTSGKVKCMTCAKPEAKRSLRIPAAPLSRGNTCLHPDVEHTVND